MAADRLVRAAARLQRLIGLDDCAVVGGLAVSAHGFVRATRGADILAAVPLEEARRRLAAGGVEARLHSGDPTEGDVACLRGVVELPARGHASNGVPFDVLPPLVALEPRHTIELRIGADRLRVADLDMLFRLKLKAGGIRDLYDVAVLVALQPAWEARARELAATDARLRDRLAELLEDPRTRAQADEARRHDRTRPRRPRRRG